MSHTYCLTILVSNQANHAEICKSTTLATIVPNCQEMVLLATARHIRGGALLRTLTDSLVINTSSRISSNSGPVTTLFRLRSPIWLAMLCAVRGLSPVIIHIRIPAWSREHRRTLRRASRREREWRQPKNGTQKQYWHQKHYRAAAATVLMARGPLHGLQDTDAIWTRNGYLTADYYLPTQG